MTNQPVVVTTNTKLRRMTRETAESHVKQINQNAINTRVLLLDLYIRRGWKSLGYASMRECMNAEFIQSQSYLYRVLQAAKIERKISPIGEIGTIPESQLRPLSDLSPAHWIEAWTLANDFARNGKLTAVVVKAAVDQVMERIKQPAIPPTTGEQLAPDSEPKTAYQILREEWAAKLSIDRTYIIDIDKLLIYLPGFAEIQAARTAGESGEWHKNQALETWSGSELLDHCEQWNEDGYRFETNDFQAPSPAMIDFTDPITGEISRTPVDANLKATEPEADPAPAPAPDWKSIIDVDKFYGIDMHDRKVFTRGYAVQHQADMAYPRAPGQTNLRILIGSKLLAFLMPGQMYDHYQPYPSVPAPTSTPFTPAAPIVPFDFDPLGVYLYNPLEKQLYTDQFPSVVSAQRDERADARWFPETGAIITRNWQRRFADYTLMTLAERSAKTAPLTSIKDAISQPYTDTPRSQWEAGKADAVELVTDYALLPSVQVDLKDSKGFRFEGYTIAGTIAPERALSTYGDQEWTQLRKFQDSFNFMMKAEMTRRLQAAAQPASAVQPV
jgi:hypothetical protein